ncbi:MAG: hypothetical protein WBK51_05810 [Polaromonas sp.]
MIYSKTELGLNAIKDRSAGLTPRQRSVLIMCDGKRSSDEILKNTAGLGVTVQDLESLVSQQMLVSSSPAVVQAAAVQTAAPVISSASPVPATKPELAPDVRRTVSPEELKILIRRATKQLEALLGPSCESMSLKLEKSKTYDDFAIKIHDIRRVLVSIRSEKIADEFLEASLV